MSEVFALIVSRLFDPAITSAALVAAVALAALAVAGLSVFATTLAIKALSRKR